MLDSDDVSQDSDTLCNDIGATARGDAITEFNHSLLTIKIMLHSEGGPQDLDASDNFNNVLHALQNGVI